MVGRLMGREGGLLRSLQVDCRLSTCILVFMKAISAHSLPLKKHRSKTRTKDRRYNGFALLLTLVGNDTKK